jgi:hypothetical protein
MDKKYKEILYNMLAIYSFFWRSRETDPAPCPGASLETLEFSTGVYILNFCKEVCNFIEVESVLERLPISSLTDRLSAVLVNKAESAGQLASALVNPKVNLQTLKMEKEKITGKVHELLGNASYPKLIADEAKLSNFLLKEGDLELAIKLVEDCLQGGS